MHRRVTIVDTDPEHRRILAAAMRDGGFDVVSAHSTSEQVLGSETDVVVVAADGRLIDEIHELRVNLGASIPLIVAVDGSGEARIDEIAAVGVSALVTSHDPVEITAATEAALVRGGYISPNAMRSVLDEIARLRLRDEERNVELEELVRRLQDLSVNDGLTGLKKFGYFFERLDDELGRALRHRRSLSVALCDIDDLAEVNDARGHKAGDRVLQEVAGVIEAGLRTGDVVARLGGEEFAMLLPETDVAGALLVAERIREQVAALVIPEVGRVTMSVGVAAAPDNAVDRDSLIEAAERALYLAKREGRNTTRSAGSGSVVGVQLSRSYARGGRNGVVDLLVRVLRMRDPALADHAVRTAEVALALGTQAGLKSEQLDHLRVASLLQDVGKIGVPDAILLKRGSLTPEEWETIRDHPKKGFELVGGLVHPEAAEAVLNNHERWDGEGYPRGISGERIPVLARVLLVADAYTAMTMDRSFRPPLSPSDALGELRKHAGTQFDPDIVAHMMDLAAVIDLTTIGVGALVPTSAARLAG